jgi:TRAP-type C4-dicarboxylate transport system permease small subunit
MVFAYIVNRAFIGKIWLFVEEWTSLSLVPIAYLGMGYTLRWNRHLFIDVLTRKFNRKKRDTIAIAVTVFSLLVLAFMIERSLTGSLIRSTRRSGVRAYALPMWIFSGSMFGGLCVYTLDMVFCLFSEILKKAIRK